MAAGPVGTCWASGSWSASAWEANSWAGAVVPPVTTQTGYGSGGGSRRRSVEYVKLKKPDRTPTVRAVKRKPLLTVAETDERTAAIDRQLSVTFRAPSTVLSVQEIAEHNAKAIALTEQLFADQLDGG